MFLSFSCLNVITTVFRLSILGNEVLNKSPEIRLLKLYDKTSNLMDGIWMDEEKRERYVEYTSRLCQDVEQNYGELNITRIARAII